jgi:hypothetical protein
MRRYGDCRDRHWRGDRGRGALGPATTRTSPGSLGATSAADVGTATSATDVGTATSPTTSLYPVPSLLTDR